MCVTAKIAGVPVYETAIDEQGPTEQALALKRTCATLGYAHIGDDGKTGLDRPTSRLITEDIAESIGWHYEPEMVRTGCQVIKKQKSISVIIGSVVICGQPRR